MKLIAIENDARTATSFSLKYINFSHKTVQGDESGK